MNMNHKSDVKVQQNEDNRPQEEVLKELRFNLDRKDESIAQLTKRIESLEKELMVTKRKSSLFEQFAANSAKMLEQIDQQLTDG